MIDSRVQFTPIASFPKHSNTKRKYAGKGEKGKGETINIRRNTANKTACTKAFKIPHIDNSYADSSEFTDVLLIILSPL